MGVQKIPHEYAGTMKLGGEKKGQIRNVDFNFVREVHQKQEGSLGGGELEEVTQFE